MESFLDNIFIIDYKFYHSNPVILLIQNIIKK